MADVIGGGNGFFLCASTGKGNATGKFGVRRMNAYVDAKAWR